MIRAINPLVVAISTVARRLPKLEKVDLPDRRYYVRTTVLIGEMMMMLMR
jgi:hypothetical protein